jgi:hypothetical protein
LHPDAKKKMTPSITLCRSSCTPAKIPGPRGKIYFCLKRDCSRMFAETLHAVHKASLRIVNRLIVFADAPVRRRKTPPQQIRGHNIGLKGSSHCSEYYALWLPRTVPLPETSFGYCKVASTETGKKTKNLASLMCHGIYEFANQVTIISPRDSQRAFHH